MTVMVRDGNVEGALRALKKKLERGGVQRDMRSRESYEKPGDRRRRKIRADTKRIKKAEKARQ
jgi:small subunit ribosomal protein S21